MNIFNVLYDHLCISRPVTPNLYHMVKDLEPEVNLPILDFRA